MVLVCLNTADKPIRECLYGACEYAKRLRQIVCYDGHHDIKLELARLSRKFDTARKLVPKPVIETVKGAEVGIIAYGSTAPAVEEARYLLVQANGPKSDFLRLRALPCTDEVNEFVKSHQRVYVVEANRDGQLRQILGMTMPEQGHKLIPACHSDGLPLTARWVKETILAQEAK